MMAIIVGIRINIQVRNPIPSPLYEAIKLPKSESFALRTDCSAGDLCLLTVGGYELFSGVIQILA